MKNRKCIEILEREREREQYLEKISSSFDEEKEKNAKIIKSSKKQKELFEVYKWKKRVDYTYNVSAFL